MAIHVLVTFWVPSSEVDIASSWSRQMGSMEFDPSMPVGSIHSTESREKALGGFGSGIL